MLKIIDNLTSLHPELFLPYIKHISSMFQWRPNPNYLVGGGNFISFTRPLHEILPDYYITFLNQNRLVFGTGNWAFNGKLRLINRQ